MLPWLQLYTHQTGSEVVAVLLLMFACLFWHWHNRLPIVPAPSFLGRLKIVSTGIWIAICWPQLVEIFGVGGGRLALWPSLLFRLGLLAGLRRITIRHTNLWTVAHLAWLLLTTAGQTHLRSRSELLLEFAVLVGILATS